MSLTFDSLLPSVSGVVYGADDFLPCLTWVLLRSDVVTLQLDTNYMMELLDPTQLQGEGTNYTDVSCRPTETYTVPVKGLDKPTHSRVFYFYNFLHSTFDYFSNNNEDIKTLK
jgi:hypothetical protein